MGKRVSAVLVSAVVVVSTLATPALAAPPAGLPAGPPARPAEAAPGGGTGPAEAAPGGGTGPAEAAPAVARSAGQAVELTGLRTETQRVFADPSGTVTVEQYALPVRVRRSGGWVPVDTTLRRYPSGTVGPRAAAVELAFSGGGDRAPLARIAQRGGEAALGWPGRLPVPELDGSTATYRNVLPGVDLVVTAGVLGFSEVLVVRTPAAARHAALATLRFAARTSGLSLTTDPAGNITLVDGAGNPAFHGGTPVMWDSGGRHAVMRVTTGPGELAVRPDRALLTGPETRFPVYVDPGITWIGNRQAWVLVRKAYPNSVFYSPSGEVARVGHETQTGMTDRSLFRMNTSAARGKHILKATFRAHETWAWSCSPRPVELWRTGSISTSTSWNNQPSWTRRQDSKNVAKGWSSSCPAGGVEFNATEAVTYAAARNLASITLGLRSPDETDPYYWKKFANNPVLTIVYNSVPGAPTGLTIDPGLPCLTGTGRAVVGTATPTLRAKLTDPDGTVQELKPGIEMATLAGTTVPLPQPTAKTRSGNVYPYAVPAGMLATNTSYRWRMHTHDSVEWGPWSGWCEPG